MSEVKFFVWFGNAIGYCFTGIWGLNWIMPILKIEGLDFSGWKSDLIIFLIILFWAQKGFFAIIRNVQEAKSRQLSLKKKAHDVEKELEE